MSRIAVVWSGLTDDDEEAQSWYENRHVPATITKLESSARTAEQTPENPFQEVNEVNGKHMTIYDLPEEESIEDFEAKIGPALGDVPLGARLNTRSYKEYFKVHGDEWRDDIRDVRMWATVLWQPKPEVYDEFIEWFINSFIPGMLDSPELLRTRVFTLEHATNIRAQKYEPVDKDSLLEFLTIWEFETEEFPWEILVYLGSSEKWRYYMEGGLVDWEIAQYMEYRDGDEDEDDEERYSEDQSGDEDRDSEDQNSEDQNRNEDKDHRNGIHQDTDEDKDHRNGVHHFSEDDDIESERGYTDRYVIR